MEVVLSELAPDEIKQFKVDIQESFQKGFEAVYGKTEGVEYVKFRRSKCPWGDNKPFCANCKIHCYKPEMREKIKEVMRFSGPRMIFYHPVIALNHLIETKRQKKKLKKEEQKGNVR